MKADAIAVVMITYMAGRSRRARRLGHTAIGGVLFVSLVLSSATPVFSQPNEPSEADEPILASYLPTTKESVDAAHETLNALRLELGLEPFQRHQELDLAAQRKVEHSVEGDYFEFTSPDGIGLDHWLSDVGYVAASASEKLAEANRPVADIVDSWRERSKRNETSVLHPHMIDVGIGVAMHADMYRMLVIVAVSEEEHARFLLAQLSDAETLEQEFLDELNAFRGQESLPVVEPHPALRSAARELAVEQQRDGAQAGRRRQYVDLERRIQRSGYQVREARQLIAIGPTSLEELGRSWFGDPASQSVMRRRWLTEAGLAVEVAEGPDGPVAVWVLTLARPDI